MKISEFKLIDAHKHKEEFSRVIHEFNITEQPFPAEKTIHALFSEVAAQHGDKIALIFKDRSIDYKTLDEQSDQMASFLMDNGVRPEDIVAILMDTSLEMIISMLGILKAGGAYVGINKEYPLERIKFVLNDTQSRIILSQKKFIKELNKLQWECPAMTAYLLVDTDEVYKVEEEPNELMRKDLWDFVGEDATNDIEGGGWLSSYTGEPLTREIMTDYSNNVLEKLRPYLTKETRVLEIGCASGISMFNILPHVKEYYGTDLSDSILKKTAAAAHEKGYGNVVLSCMPAHDIHLLEDNSFDIVIINSVVQCFNGLNYLREVTGKAITLLKENGIIFFGDIMDLESKDELIHSLITFKMENEGKGYKTKTDWSNELFVSKHFFDDLSGCFPFIESVSHSEKHAAISSELSNYRYDTIITVNKISAGKDNRKAPVKRQFDNRVLNTYSKYTPQQGVGAENLAYIIYTSGSSGNPKGVLIEHKGIVRLVRDTNYIHFVPEDTVLQANAISFDASAFEIWGALLNGAALHLVPREDVLDEYLFPELLHTSRITVALFIPSLFNHYIQKFDWMFSRLRVLLLGGEAISPDHVRLLQQTGPGVQLINAYGPTENSVISTTYNICAAMDRIPIGKPVSNTQCYILNDANNPVPVGIAGELCVSGEGLAREYLNDPKLTAEKFVPHPFRRGKKLYKTGDLARWLETGDIEFLGRKDNQVKIRGFRVELGEIEKTLLALPGMQECAVIAAANLQELLAFVVTATKTDGKDIREQLGLQIPEYMMPTHIIPVEKIPLTVNGKTDKVALLELREEQETGGTENGQPANEIEEQLMKIWCSLLEVKKVGTNSDFFKIGGHSLKATQMVSRIKKELNVVVTIRDIFAFPTIHQIAQCIAQKTAVPDELIVPVDKQEYYEVSHAQQRLWLLDQLESDKTLYLMPAVFYIHGALNIPALEKALATLVERHESLRTVFITVDHLPKQKILEDIGKVLEYRDLRGDAYTGDEVELLLKETSSRPFILCEGPLVRATVFQVEERKFAFVFNIHHIVCDGWSLSILLDELFAVYQAYCEQKIPALPVLKFNYKDFSHWQNQQLKGKLLVDHKTYWLRKFAGEIPVLELPTDYIRPQVKTYNGNSLSFWLDAALKEQLHAYCGKSGASLFMLLLAITKTLLYKYTGQEDIVVGTPIAGRQHVDLEGQVGLYVNTLALRTAFAEEEDFQCLLQRVKETTLDAYEHQLYPFDGLVEELRTGRNLSRSPMFDVWVALLNTGMSVRSLPETLDITTYNTGAVSSKFDLAFQFMEYEDGIAGGIEYNTDLFCAATVDSMHLHFMTLLKAILACDRMPLYQLSAIPEEEQQGILDHGQGATLAYPEVALHRLFEEQVIKTPENTALICSGEYVSYRVLNEQANKLAHYLVNHCGIGTGDLVGIMTGRTSWLLTGMLAIMKAGAAYVPIDPQLPPLRTTYILENSHCKLLLTDQKVTGASFSSQQSDITDPAIYEASYHGRLPDVDPESLLYVMYTSGSTGKPKGVMVRHRNVVNFLKSMEQCPGIVETDKLLALTTCSFDISVLEIFLPLIKGATVILIGKEELYDKRLLGEVIADHQPTMMQATPSTFAMLLDTGFNNPGNMTILCGGERLLPDLGEKLVKISRSVWNMYGPTETTIWSTIKRIREARDTSSIGRPVANTTVYVLDKHRRLVPKGIPGELFIGGDGVSAGYYLQPALTSEKFIDNPFHTGKVYATGDIVKLTEEDELVFVGRKDRQVKLRGYRMEMGEIEQVLMNCPGVKMATVIVKKVNGEEQLLAYYTAYNNVEAEAVRRNAARFLPDYMMPAYLVLLDHFPLTPNHKIDADALPLPALRETTDTAAEVRLRSTEKALMKMWEEVLVTKPGLHDNFFELGGHSLKITRLLTLIREELGVQLELITVFLHPTIHRLAAVIDAAATAPADEIPLIEEQDHYGMSFGQQRFFLSWELEKTSAANNLPLAFVLDGKLNIAALETAFNILIERHEVLRTLFFSATGSLRQKIQHPGIIPFRIIYTDLRTHATREITAREMAVAEADMPFDLERGPLMRVQVISMENDKYLLLLTMHHVISDEWSLEVLFKEIILLYNAGLSGSSEDVLPPLRLQHKDYSAWQQGQLSGGSLTAAAQYFKHSFSSPAPALHLAAVYPAPEAPVTGAGRIIFDLDPARSGGIKTLCSHQEITIYMALLGILNVWLLGYTGQRDIVIGTPAAARNHKDLEGQIGAYMNILALRTTFPDDITFTTLLKRIRQQVIDTLQHQHYPFEWLQRSLSAGKSTPLYELGFTWQNTADVTGGDAAHTLQDINIGSYEQLGMSLKSGFWIHGWERGDSIRFSFSYNKLLYRPDTVDKMVADFQQIITAVCAAPDKHLDQLAASLKKVNKSNMDARKINEKNLERFNNILKKPVATDNGALVITSQTEGDQPYPLVLRPATDNIDVMSWAAENKETLLKKLSSAGALLLRGFGLSSLESFRALFNVIVDTPLDYVDQSSPRSLVADKLYTSTNHPADQLINMHNELSYSHKWPQHIAFFCLQPATQGGETPIADSRQVLANLSAATREEFLRRGIRYTRNLVEGIGLSWQSVYQTDDPLKVAQYCNEHDIMFEWKGDKHLKVSWTRPAIVPHPVTGEWVWFNHGHFFNTSNLDAMILESIGGEDDMPFNTYYGDGAAISRQTLDEIKQAYEKAKMNFTWQKGDVLLLDNMLMSHGRNPYKGERTVLVGMGTPVS